MQMQMQGAPQQQAAAADAGRHSVEGRDERGLALLVESAAHHIRHLLAGLDCARCCNHAVAVQKPKTVKCTPPGAYSISIACVRTRSTGAAGAGA